MLLLHVSDLTEYMFWQGAHQQEIECTDFSALAHWIRDYLTIKVLKQQILSCLGFQVFTTQAYFVEYPSMISLLIKYILLQDKHLLTYKKTN